MSSLQYPLLGAHISITGGLYKALERGESIGCTAIQIFTKSNRQWAPKHPSEDDIKLFKETQKKTGIKIVLAHASYLINLGSPDPDIFRKSVVALTKELEVCEALTIPYLVVHPGSATTGTRPEAIKSIAHGIEKVFHHIPGNSMILLETMAGQGTVVGKTFEELAAIRNHISTKHRVGICLDTCHIFAAGYDITTETGYKKMWHDFDRIIGFSNLKILHMNDSLHELGSHVDRHEAIGKGHIGIKGFSFFMNDKKLTLIPKILETPKTSLQDDKQNIEKLKYLIKRNEERV